MLPQRLLNLLRDKDVALVVRYDKKAKLFVARLEFKAAAPPRVVTQTHTFEDKDLRLLADRIEALCGDMELALASGVNEAQQLGVLSRLSKSQSKSV